MDRGDVANKLIINSNRDGKKIKVYRAGREDPQVAEFLRKCDVAYRDTYTTNSNFIKRV